MAHVLTNAEKIRRLHWNTALNATNTVFAQLTYFGSAFVLFLHELQLNNTQIGFILSLVPFTGLVALLVAPAVARFGYKRTFVTFYVIRKTITLGLLLVPWVLAQYGANVMLVYITVIVTAFAISKAIADTAILPWAQEFIPDFIRGRYGAITDIVARIAAILSLALASVILGLSTNLDRFMLLFAIAIVFGFAAVWSSSHIPGGAPAKMTNAVRISHRHLIRVLRDNNFVLYMAGLSVLTIGTTPMASFLPLFLEQQVGLSESQVVSLQISSLVGGLSSTYLLGWAADRYGSKPVMMSGLYLKIALPLVWMFMPRFSDISLLAALAASFVNGIADIAWAIGSARLLYVKVVPPEKRAEYMAMYYASIGLIGGLSQLVGGRVLDFTQNLTGQFLIFTIDPFFPLFVFAIVLSALCVLFFNRVKADSPVSLSEFAGLFTHGNPILALESLFRYYRAKDERATVAMTQRLGQTQSPLTVDELLEALKDPRFNVRFEAIISIARRDSDPRLVEALCGILDGTELSLSVIAAWALGRIGDERAVLTLRHGLDSQYRSIQAHCARALGTLGDTSIVPLLLERLKTETDKGLRNAYSSALGQLCVADSIPTLFDILAQTENEGARLELTLALARIVGQEHHFIRLLRQMREDQGTAASQAVTALKRRLDIRNDTFAAVLNECADAFAKDDFEAGIPLLNRLMVLLPADSHTETGKVVLRACAESLDEYKTAYIEYLLLTLHTLHVAAE